MLLCLFNFGNDIPVGYIFKLFLLESQWREHRLVKYSHTPPS